MVDERAVGIGLLRPDLFGTYGDGGNATVLAQRLRWRGVAAEIISIGPGQTVPPHVRVILIGGGEDRSQIALLHDDEVVRGLRAAVDEGAAVLGVCAGLQVLGHEFAGPDGSLHRGLGLLDCVSYRLDHRAVGECVIHAEATLSDSDDTALTGFENHLGSTTLGSGATPLGLVAIGVGNGDGTDGAVSGRIIGTYLHGPVLARNPALADHLLEFTLGPLPTLRVPEVDRLRSKRFSAAARERRSGRLRIGHR